MTEIHVRDASLEYSEGQLFGRLVPYGVPARVVDVMGDGRLDVYQEGFRSGAFATQTKSTEPGVIKRVAFWHTHDHNDGAGYFGPARSLEERDDGLYGEFRVLTSKRADLADLMTEGINQLSIEFREMRGGTAEEDGVRWRTDARIFGVALDPKGAYPGAEVLSYRSIDELVELAEAERDEERRRVEAEAETTAKLAAEEAAASVAAEMQAEKARMLAEAEAFAAEQRRRQLELVERYR